MSDPTLSKMWGCVSPSQKLAKGAWEEKPIKQVSINGTIYQIYRHPELLLMPGTVETISELEYNDDHNIAEPWRSLSAKTAAVRRFYDAALRACTKMKEALNV